MEEFYWTKTLEDLQRVTGLKIRLEMVKTMSMTESFMYTAAQVFGKGDGSSRPSTGPTLDVGSAAEMKAMAGIINGVGE